MTFLTGYCINPFDSSDDEFDDFPLHDELAPGAGTYTCLKPGPWSVIQLTGQMNCGSFSLSIPANPPETSILDVQDGGQTIIGSGLLEVQGVSIVMNANPSINGRYTGSFQGMEQGVPITINYVWQVVTDEYIVGLLTATATSEGVCCTVYRSFEMDLNG